MRRAGALLADAAAGLRTAELDGVDPRVNARLAAAMESAAVLARHDEYLADRASIEAMQTCAPVYDVLVRELAEVAELLAPPEQDPPF